MSNEILKPIEIEEVSNYLERIIIEREKDYQKYMEFTKEVLNLMFKSHEELLRSLDL